MPSFTPIPTPWPGLPIPVPSPGIGVPIPQPVIPGPSGPTTGIGIPMPGSGTPTAPSFTQPFADLFKFDINWRYVFAVIGILITVYMAEQYSPEAAIAYVIILLLGIIVVDGRFGPELERLVK